jgi:hypothetical protein
LHLLNLGTKKSKVQPQRLLFQIWVARLLFEFCTSFLQFSYMDKFIFTNYLCFFEMSWRSVHLTNKCFFSSSFFIKFIFFLLAVEHLSLLMRILFKNNQTILEAWKKIWKIRIIAAALIRGKTVASKTRLLPSKIAKNRSLVSKLLQIVLYWIQFYLSLSTFKITF